MCVKVFEMINRIGAETVIPDCIKDNYNIVSETAVLITKLKINDVQN